MTLLTFLMCVCFAAWMIAMALTIIGTRLSLKHFKRVPPFLDAPFSLYPVSILKPLKGADPGLVKNLESFFLLDYPVFELLFSVADPNDPAAKVARRLIEKYPRVPARLVVGTVEAGLNPKVNNLMISYPAAKYDWVLISDSNVRVAPDYLKRMVAHLDGSTGMVTSVVSGQQEEGLGGELETMFLNTFYARGMILADTAGRPCVMGKSMLFRKSVAARFGGIKTLGRYLAEDFMAGEAMLHLRLKVITASDPVPQFIGKLSLGQFWLRHIRWGRIRKTQAPLAFAIEPFLGCLVSGLLGALACSRLFALDFAAVIAAHLLIWSFCDFLVFARTQGRIRVFTPLIWLIRESLALPLWFHIASGNSILWRGQKYVLKTGGLLAESRVSN